MKKILVLIALFGAVNCTSNTEQKQSAKATAEDSKFEPKFILGQEVTVQSGFLKGQQAKIINCERRVDDGQGTYASDVVCYTIELKNAPTEMYQGMIWKNVSERELLQ
jgi:hypothetical protein